jgi:hypothetical protein
MFSEGSTTDQNQRTSHGGGVAYSATLTNAKEERRDSAMIKGPARKICTWFLSLLIKGIKVAVLRLIQAS